MDLHSQETISRLAEQHGTDDLMVILGAPDAESSEIAAETVVLGDPAYAGALAGVQLGLDVYHLLENEIREAIPEEVWEEQVGLMVDILDAQAVASSVASMRGKANSGGDAG